MKNATLCAIVATLKGEPSTMTVEEILAEIVPEAEKSANEKAARAEARKELMDKLAPVVRSALQGCTMCAADLLTKMLPFIPSELGWDDTCGRKLTYFLIHDMADEITIVRGGKVNEYTLA